MGKLFQKFQEVQPNLNIFVDYLKETVANACNQSKRQKTKKIFTLFFLRANQTSPPRPSNPKSSSLLSPI